MKIRRYIKGDKVIWMVVVILLVVSLLSVYSTTGNLAYQYRSGNTFSYLLEQIAYILVGLLFVFLFQMVHYRWFIKFSTVGLYVAIVLLLLTFIIGKNYNEATRWLPVPGTGKTFMPSDVAKIALVMYLSRVLALNQENKKDYKNAFRNMALAIAGVCVLILPANFSTAALVFLTAFALLFVGKVPFKYMALLVFAGVFAFSLFISISLLINREGRIATWKNRIETYMEGGDSDNYQADQAKVAIVQGGLFGKGPGKSTQRNLLPHPYSDFIYAIIIEEYGSLVGGVLVIILYLWLFFRAGLIIRKSKSTYGAFLAFGLSMGLVLQAFVNMAVSVGLIPVTGQTLPLVSKGGSSIVFTSIAVGMLLSLSWSTREGVSVEEAVPETASAGGGPAPDLTTTDAIASDESPAEAGKGRKKRKKDPRTEFEVHE
jgi:cell division protein FtsW